MREVYGDSTQLSLGMILRKKLWKQGSNNYVIKPAGTEEAKAWSKVWTGLYRADITTGWSKMEKPIKQPL